LTTTAPPDSISTFTGYTTHPPLHLETRYYVADVGVWCDEIPVTREGASGADTAAEGKENKDETPEGGVDEDVTKQWAHQFQAEEAKEVLTAIGAVILVLPSSRHAAALKEAVSASVLAAAKEFRQAAEEERVGGDVVGICCVVATSMSTEEQGDEEDKIMEGLGMGWEVVFWDGRADIEKEKGKKNEFGGKGSLYLDFLLREWHVSTLRSGGFGESRLICYIYRTPIHPPHPRDPVSERMGRRRRLGRSRL
jgi:hypothetical protein